MDIEEASVDCEKILAAIGSYFVGEKTLLGRVLAAALSNGHVLFEDYPGLGKTLLAKAFAKVTGCSWKRIQFTPDLMPTDIVGTKVWRTNTSEFALVKGPVFTNIVLADEINRSPPKVQSALLECMEERQVTIEGETLRLDPPFFVLATQNPIELEGTYPLPEAQMDRFMLRLSTGYVKDLEGECEILRRRMDWRRDDPIELIKPAISGGRFSEIQGLIEKRVYVDEQIVQYISKIVRMTREHPLVEVGSSPRGALSLLKVSRAYAVMMGRDFVTPDDVKLFAADALGHRLILKMETANEEEGDSNSIVEGIVAGVEVPKQFRRM